MTKFNDQERYVASWKQIPPSRSQPLPEIYVKLYMSDYALDNDALQHGFSQNATFPHASGPITVTNLLRWYGIDQFDSGALNDLRVEMKTNNWKVLGKTCRGTSTPNFVETLRRHLLPHIPPGLEFRHEHGPGLGVGTLRSVLEGLLRGGHPIAVDFRTGSSSGHRDLIVGLQSVPGLGGFENDMVFFANYPSMSWSSFVRAWKRDYRVFDKQVLELEGEHPYVRSFLCPADSPPSSD